VKPSPLKLRLIAALMSKLAGLLVCLALAAPATPAAAKPAVLVELFTAQGCSSCGNINAVVGQLAERPGIIALTWPVDYWDYLGWKDTFAKPEFADRQRAYDKRFDVREVYTPQVIVDGHLQASGATAGAVDSLVREARRSSADPPDMKFLVGGRIAVGSAPRPRGGGEVWLIRYDPRAQLVEVKAGDNRGQTVPQRNVVREIERLGTWAGRPVVFKAPAPSEEGLESLVVVQGSNGGRILGVLQQAREPGRKAATSSAESKTPAAGGG